MTRLPWCAALLLVIAPIARAASAAEPIRVAAPGLTAVDVPPDRASFYAEHLAQRLSFEGLRVQTAKEIAALVGLERQKAILGCSSDSCITDLGGALGADAILLGEVARVGEALSFNLRMIAVRDGARLGGFTARVNGEDAVLDALDRGARLLAQDVAQKLGRTLGPTAGLNRTEHLQTGPRSSAWIPAVGGAAFAGVGAAFLVMARGNHLALTEPTTILNGQTAEEQRRQGSLNQALGIGGIALGVAGLGTAAAMFLMGGGSSTLEAGVALGPAGGAITIAGVLP